jgi:hypothetical protein
MVQLQERIMSKRYHNFWEYFLDAQTLVCQAEAQVTSQVLGEAKPGAEKTNLREFMCISIILIHWTVKKLE